MNKPFANLDGREEKTRQLRRMAFDILGGEDQWGESSYMIQSLACRAAALSWMIDNNDLTASEFTQANNAYLGITRRLSEPQAAKVSMPRMQKDEVLEAISMGVKMAVWDIATNSTGMPCADFYDAIRQGVSESIGGLTDE